MADFPTFKDFFRFLRDEILSRSARLSRDSAERDGTDVNVLLAATAAACEEVVGQVVDVEAGLYLDSARGQALDRLVFSLFGMLRKQASPSFGSAAFRTNAPAATAFSIPVNLLLSTQDGVQFVTTASATYPAGSTGPVLVAVRSTLAGLGQRAKIGAITSVVGQIPGQPADLTVTNDVATAGDDDEEKDDALRDRARRFWLAARRGTNQAIEAAALGVPGVRTARAVEMIDAVGLQARLSVLVISDAFTDALVELDAVPPAYQAQSQVLAQTVFAALSDVRPSGTFVHVLVAQVVMLSVRLSLTFRAGADPDVAANAARAAVVNYVNGLRPGEPFRVEAARDALRVVPGVEVTGGEIDSPPGDVLAAPLQVLRSEMRLASACSVQSDRPLLATANPDALMLVGQGTS